MSVTVDYKFSLTTRETLSAIIGATTSTVDYSQFDISGRLNSTSTPPATEAVYMTLTGTGAGSGTIDLTNLTGPLNSVITAAGLKLQAIRITSATTSTGNFAIVEGAANGYAGVTHTVGPGEAVMQLFNDRLADVAAGDKTLDWTRSGSLTVNITLIFG